MLTGLIGEGGGLTLTGLRKEVSLVLAEEVSLVLTGEVSLALAGL